MSDYHYLVASLPEIAFDGSKVNFSIERFREEVCGALSKTDLKKISLFFYVTFRLWQAAKPAKSPFLRQDCLLNLWNS